MATPTARANPIVALRPQRPPTNEGSTATPRETSKVHQRLERIQDQMRRIRATERVLAEQVSYLDEVAADAETRKLVAQTPLADREARDARTDLQRHRAQLDEARRQVAELLEERDQLLDRLFELEAARRAHQ